MSSIDKLTKQCCTRQTGCLPSWEGPDCLLGSYPSRGSACACPSCSCAGPRPCRPAASRTAAVERGSCSACCRQRRRASRLSRRGIFCSQPSPCWAPRRPAHRPSCRSSCWASASSRRWGRACHPYYWDQDHRGLPGSCGHHPELCPLAPAACVRYDAPQTLWRHGEGAPLPVKGIELKEN